MRSPPTGRRKPPHEALPGRAVTAGTGHRIGAKAPPARKTLSRRTKLYHLHRTESAPCILRNLMLAWCPRLPRCDTRKILIQKAPGEVREWTKRHAWRACVPKRYRGFESHPLRSPEPRSTRHCPHRSLACLKTSASKPSAVSRTPTHLQGLDSKVRCLLAETRTARLT